MFFSAYKFFKMKVIILCLFGFIVGSYSRHVQSEIDWNNVFHMQQYHPKAPTGFLPMRPRLTPRIVNGEEAKPNQFPHQVGVFASMGIGTAFCGGSLISKKFVMTAAHCADGAYSFRLVIGTHHINNPDAGSVTLTSTKATIHPNWDSYNIVNDIAIIELPSEVQLSAQIQVVKLPGKSMVGNTFAGDMSTISGWGITSDSSSSISPVLRYSTNPVLTNQDCSTHMAGLNIPSSQVCQSGQGNKGSCNGDSGGPLVVYQNGKPLQIGITSYGLIYGCEKGYAVAYTRVTAFLDFIADNTDVKIDS